MKTFHEPKIEVVKFAVEDIVTTSGIPGDGNMGGDGGDRS